MDYYIQHGITVAAVAAALYFLNRASRTSVTPQKDGTLKFILPKIYLVAGYIGCIIGVGLLAIPFSASDEEFWDLVVLSICFFIFFGGIGTICILYYRNHYVTLDDTVITVKSVYGKINTVNWTDIATVKFSHLSGLLVVTSHSGTKVKLHQHLKGLSTFVKMIEAKTPFSAKSLKLPFKIDS